MKKLSIVLLIFISLILLSCQQEEIKMYEVTFTDINGNIIETVSVEEGKSVTPPSAPDVRFYTFNGWSEDLSNITKDVTIQAQYVLSSEAKDMTHYNYWLHILSNKYDIDAPLMTEEEINEYNKLIVRGKMYTNVVDVLSMDKTISSYDVLSMISSYSKISRYTVYNENSNSTLSSSERDIILNNRNLDNIPTTVDIKFGLITDFAWMRAYPTNAYANSYSRDQFQETSLNVGEVVVVLHESLDNKWYFVQATNYYGWVEKQYIALCSYEDAYNFSNPNDNLVVISDYVNIENSHVRMGQSFPLISNDENYNILFPTRNSDGNLILKNITLNKTDDYSVGYLTYNYTNVFKQGFKLLGIDYSWGDKEKDGRDCSSTQNSIYACFGFKLPRNTGNQNDIPKYGESFSSITVNQVINNYLPGTLIFSSGHVMMYIGCNNEGIAYILHNTSAGDAKCILQSLSDYGINKIKGSLKLQ